MAIQLNTTYIGRIEDIIYYERLGDYLIRTVPRQAANSIKSASAFGKAASLAKNLRTLLAPIIRNPRDKNMQNRLTVAVSRFLADADAKTVIDPQNNPLAGFQFAADSALNQCLLFPLVVSGQSDGNIRFSIPAINPVDAIAAPPGTTKAEIRFMAISFHPDKGQLSAASSEGLEIPYTDGLQAALNAVLQSEYLPGSVAVVAVSVRYWNNIRPISAAGFMPAQIIATIRQNTI
ncbi:hypothetical protein GZH53_05990 [Flavihumibacter sp. R14]|nr:hypothetical protein [Flavihumibacter soli]